MPDEALFCAALGRAWQPQNGHYALVLVAQLSDTPARNDGDPIDVVAAKVARFGEHCPVALDGGVRSDWGSGSRVALTLPESGWGLLPLIRRTRATLPAMEELSDDEEAVLCFLRTSSSNKRHTSEQPATIATCAPR